MEELICFIFDVIVFIFFVIVGIKINLNVFNLVIFINCEGLVIVIFLIVVVIVGKVVCGFSVFGLGLINCLVIGVGMVLWGEVGLVFVFVGFVSGVLFFVLDVVIILMVIFIIFLVFFLLWVVFGKVEVEIEEVLEIFG